MTDRGSSSVEGAYRDLEALRVPVHDDHTHLNFGDDSDIERWIRSLSEAGGRVEGPPGIAEAIAELDAAESVGVAGVVQVGTNLADSRWAVALAERDARVLAAIAIHPNDAPELAAGGALDEALAVLDSLAAHPRVRAMGETGLDWFRLPGEAGGPEGDAADRARAVDAQVASFEAHIAIAKRRGLAVQIHDRDAHDDVLSVLARVGAPERTVLHCFSGDADFARRALDAGCHLSFAGTVTFKNAGYLREALGITPIDRILVETDAPFLAPQPYRGRRNTPAYIPVTLRAMAEVRGIAVDALAERVHANAIEVYGPWA
ncbi:MAG TPA: TatD family hydrolase [Microbacteriaceae bacterium]|nr:TatD family hydrolase [Microbacteriaceae bacterium]